MVNQVDFSAVTNPEANSSMRISVTVPGTATQKAYQDALKDLSKRAKVPGFTAGPNKRVPDQILVNYYGAQLIKTSALELITDSAVKKAIEDAGVRAIGQAELIQDPESLVATLTPGEPLHLDVKVDIWPEVKYNGPYTGFTVTAEAPAFDKERYDATMDRLRERACTTAAAPADYAAGKGDAVIVDMYPFEVLDDGSRGDALPQLAGGEEVEIVLDEEKFMPGLMEGLLGITAGQTREIAVNFPERLGGAAAVLSGKRAVFDVTCREVRTRALPALDDDFANAIRPGLTMAELREEVLSALNQEGDKKKNESRNAALEAALLERITCEIPETLMTERARQKFAIMMADMKAQGTHSDEELRGMITPENFNKYKDIARGSTTKQLQVSLALSDIAEKEGLQVNPLEVDDQMELLRAEAKGEPFDEAAARERVEATLEKEMVLQWIAERSTINYTEVAPEPSA
eukprot:TRINITY_DN380_c0_g1_i1.p1 TRINITY_DN380_c0_g1~~TRINITY_DN380_c0_g1_i1.p1  ORF type:complete len:528 (-),score=233.62 TRINITY_DN380_c0_g1_i1:159-1544(-)